MANKEIKTRIQNKRDTAANWEAVAATFQPLDGELIIVDTSGGETRFKVGRYDTVKGRLLYYNEIPFTDEPLYDDLNDKLKDVVSTEAQTLTDAQKAQARENIGASSSTDVVSITRGGTDASTAAAARTNLGFSYGTSVPTSAPVTGNGAVFFCQDSGSPLSIANGGTGGATQDAARTNLGLPTQDKRLLTICSGTRLVSGSNITITLDPAEAKKYSAILILLGTPLGGNYGNMYDSFVSPLSPDTWSFRFFKYTLEGQDWQCAKANLSSDWKTFTITAVSGNTNHPCWCYLM